MRDQRLPRFRTSWPLFVFLALTAAVASPCAAAAFEIARPAEVGGAAAFSAPMAAALQTQVAALQSSLGDSQAMARTLLIESAPAGREAHEDRIAAALLLTRALTEPGAYAAVRQSLAVDPATQAIAASPAQVKGSLTADQRTPEAFRETFASLEKALSANRSLEGVQAGLDSFFTGSTARSGAPGSDGGVLAAAASSPASDKIQRGLSDGVPNILFVCTGNTCRSPMAELMLRDLSDRQGLKVHVDSRGLNAEAGAPATEPTRRVLTEMRIDATGHVARPLSEEDVARADIVLAMSQDNRAALLERFPQFQGKVHLLKEYAGTGNGSISDPMVNSVLAVFPYFDGKDLTDEDWDEVWRAVVANPKAMAVYHETAEEIQAAVKEISTQVAESQGKTKVEVASPKVEAPEGRLQGFLNSLLDKLGVTARRAPEEQARASLPFVGRKSWTETPLRWGSGDHETPAGEASEPTEISVTLKGRFKKTPKLLREVWALKVHPRPIKLESYASPYQYRSSSRFAIPTDAARAVNVLRTNPGFERIHVPPGLLALAKKVRYAGPANPRKPGEPAPLSGALSADEPLGTVRIVFEPGISEVEAFKIMAAGEAPAGQLIRNARGSLEAYPHFAFPAEAARSAALLRRDSGVRAIDVNPEILELAGMSDATRRGFAPVSNTLAEYSRVERYTRPLGEIRVYFKPGVSGSEAQSIMGDDAKISDFGDGLPPEADLIFPTPREAAAAIDRLRRDPRIQEIETRPNFLAGS